MILVGLSWVLLHGIAVSDSVIPPNNYFYAFYTEDLSEGHKYPDFPSYIYGARESSRGFLKLLKTISAITGLDNIRISFIPLGIVTLPLIYGIAKRITTKRNSILIALLLSVYPYGRIIADSYLSRAAVSGILFFMVMFAYICFLQGRNPRIMMLITALSILSVNVVYYTGFYQIVLMMVPIFLFYLLHLHLTGNMFRTTMAFPMVFCATAALSLILSLLLSPGSANWLTITFKMFITRGEALTYPEEIYPVNVWYGNRFYIEFTIFLLHVLPYFISTALLLFFLYTYRKRLTALDYSSFGSIIGVFLIGVALYFVGSKLPRAIEMFSLSLVLILSILANRLKEKFLPLILIFLVIAVPTSLYGLSTPNILSQKISIQEKNAYKTIGEKLDKSVKIYTDMKSINGLILFGNHYNVESSMNYGKSLTQRNVEEDIRIFYDPEYIPSGNFTHVVVGEYMYTLAISPYSILEPTSYDVIHNLKKKNDVLYDNGAIQLIRLREKRQS